MEELNLNILIVLSILTMFTSFLFISLVLFLKPRSLTNRYFSLYLLNISVIIGYFLFSDLEFKKITYITLPVLISSVLLIGPLLWFYVNSVIVSRNKDILKHLFIPLFFGVIFLVLRVLVSVVEDENIGYFISRATFYLFIVSMKIVFVLQSGYYIFKSLKLYQKHLRRVGEVFSYTEEVNLNWLKFIIYGYIIFIVGFIGSNAFEKIIGTSLANLIFTIIVFCYIIYAGFSALKYEPIFDETKEEDEEGGEDSSKSSEIDAKSPFFIELKQQLLVAMKEDKLYLDDSLSIHSLASALNTNSKYLSLLINTEFEKSFVVFVNEFRITEAKTLLLEGKSKKLTIEGVGYEAGFKSKSAFNLAFKKFTGDTPSSFLKKEI